MSEREIISKCVTTFPGIEKEGSFGIDALLASLKLSEKPTPLELATATLATKPLTDEFKITGIDSVTKLAQTARTCADKIAEDNRQKRDEEFANAVAERADMVMAQGVLNHGSSKFTPILDLTEKPRFTGHKEVKPHAEWSAPDLTKREQKVLDTLKKLPNVDAFVYQAEEPGGGISMSWNIVPKFYIGVRPKG
jgi:hypothetical protein